MSEVILFLADEEAMVAFGQRIAQVTAGAGLIFLEGDLGRARPRYPEGLSEGWAIQGQ